MPDLWRDIVARNIKFFRKKCRGECLGRVPGKKEHCWWTAGSSAVLLLFRKKAASQHCSRWEVLNGVGVDGVGVIFPFFYAFFVFFMNFFVFFFAFLRFSSLFSSSPKGQGQTTAKFTAKKGNFTPTPSAPTPCKTSQSRQSPRQCPFSWHFSQALLRHFWGIWAFFSPAAGG